MRLFPILATAATLLATPLAASVARAECQPGPFTVALPAQRLDTRLQDLAHKTGCFVDVDMAAIAGLRAPPLKGRLTSADLFVRSVRGTGMEVGPVQGHWRVDRHDQRWFDTRIAVVEGRIARDHLPSARATPLRARLAAIRRGVAGAVRAQGFLSAAERTSYRHALDAIAAQVGLTD